jgi:hypothetical protein
MGNVCCPAKDADQNNAPVAKIAMVDVYASSKNKEVKVSAGAFPESSIDTGTNA